MTNRYAYVWSPVYVDAMVLRDKDATGDGTYEQRLYVQHDANFNTTAITNASGTVQQRFVEDAYGSPTYLTASWGSGSSTAFNWIYIHQGLRLENGGLGLYDMRTRAYSPTLGRPMQMDSAGYAAGMNRYEALASNPTNFVDPMGTWPQYPGLGSFPGGPSQGSGGVTLLPWYPGDKFPPPEILPDFPNPDAPAGQIILWSDSAGPTTEPSGVRNGGDSPVGTKKEAGGAAASTDPYPDIKIKITVRRAADGGLQIVGVDVDGEIRSVYVPPEGLLDDPRADGDIDRARTLSKNARDWERMFRMNLTAAWNRAQQALRKALVGATGKSQADLEDSLHQQVEAILDDLAKAIQKEWRTDTQGGRSGKVPTIDDIKDQIKDHIHAEWPTEGQ